MITYRAVAKDLARLFGLAEVPEHAGESPTGRLALAPRIGSS